MIACTAQQVTPAQLLSYQVGDPEPQVLPQDVGSLILGSAFGGYLFPGSVSDTRHFALDRWGNVRSDPLPASDAVPRVTSDYAVFQSFAGLDDSSFAVHRVTS